MHDDVDLLLLALEEKRPAPRDFAESLRVQLVAELGFAASEPAAQPTVSTTGAFAPRRVQAPAPRPTDGFRRFLGPMWPSTPRAALLAAAAVLLIVGTLTAGALVLRQLMQPAPRLLQLTDDFTVTDVYREKDAVYFLLLPGPDGTSAYAIRGGYVGTKEEPSIAAVVRFTVAGDAWAPPTTVLPSSALRDARLWDADVQVGDPVVSLAPHGLSVAPDGTLFVSAWASREREEGGSTVGGMTLVALAPDGTLSKVVTASELARADGFPAGWIVQGIDATASAPDLLWLRVYAWNGDQANSDDTAVLFQMVDPTGDGDWSDAILRPLQLPPSIPVIQGEPWTTTYGLFVAEPSVAGRDRSRSVLLPVSRKDGTYETYRIADPDLDGDATDPGDVNLVASTTRARYDDVNFVDIAPAPRVVLDGDRVVLDELLVPNLATQERISRLAPAGVVDIKQGLRAMLTDGVFATADGTIYVAARDQAVDMFIYKIQRLTPIPEASPGATGSPGTSSTPPS